jgi:hypothetical protein
MNSGKYLYNLNSDRKTTANKKVNSKIIQKQLRYFPTEIVNTFKKFLGKLAKKDGNKILK